MSKETNKSILTVIESVNAIISNEIGELVYPFGPSESKNKKPNSPYIKFLPIVTSIEFLGASYDELPFDTSRLQQPKIVETRFNTALKSLFHKKYIKHAKADTDYYLYDFRNAMVHRLGTSKFALTTRKESIEDKTFHLKKNSDGKTILVLEDFYDDLKKAGERLIRGFKSGEITNKKGGMGFLEITNYEE